KIRESKTLFNGRDLLIEVDGGIKPSTAPLVAEAGADVLVAGSAVFGKGAQSENIYAANIKAIRDAANGAINGAMG
ncbi:MAG: hypothetical protein L3J16_07605, partial [Anaerolineales bacterium]|nr:hypothetical protein [Anaerolineales bacterium]